MKNLIVIQVLSFETEPRLSQFTENGETFTNYLLIRDVNVNDSGKYACAPSNADPASILVHVVNGELQEAIYRAKYFNLIQFLYR